LSGACGGSVTAGQGVRVRVGAARLGQGALISWELVSYQASTGATREAAGCDRGCDVRPERNARRRADRNGNAGQRMRPSTSTLASKWLAKPTSSTSRRSIPASIRGTCARQRSRIRLNEVVGRQDCGQSQPSTILNPHHLRRPTHLQYDRAREVSAIRRVRPLLHPTLLRTSSSCPSSCRACFPPCMPCDHWSSSWATAWDRTSWAKPTGPR
jgi:hypothetical protein